jgi:hypothetical protein
MKFESRSGRGVLWFSLAVLFGPPTLCAKAQANSPTTGSHDIPIAGATDKTEASSAPAQETDKKSADDKEVSMQDVGATFKLRVNLVQVHVVVRDQHDKTVDNLKQEDFLLYDQGKLQAISSFGVETASGRRTQAKAAVKTPGDDGTKDAEVNLSLPERFVAIVFDDTHLTPGDAGPSRLAALKFLNDFLRSCRELTADFLFCKTENQKVSSQLHLACGDFSHVLAFCGNFRGTPASCGPHFISPYAPPQICHPERSGPILILPRRGFARRVAQSRDRGNPAS